MKEWYRTRGYVHFSPRINSQNIGILKHLHSYVINPLNIKKHSFFPLIHNVIVTRRYKKTKGLKFKTGRAHSFLNDKAIVESNAKERHIFYSNHLDSAIYSYYTQKILTPLYENIVNNIEGLSDCISAYRKIPITTNSVKNKNNIHFANDVFSFIKQKGVCTALAFDLSNFFDTLDHKYLKKQWCNLIESSNLPEDHYQIFKSLTDFSYVDLKDIIKEFDLKSSEHIRRKEVSVYCEVPINFRERIREKGLIKRHKFKDINGKKIGIPQGTPISAFLSNLYLLEFDVILHNEANERNALYRRYSDDIIVICNQIDEEFFKAKVDDLVHNKFFLKMNKDKIETTNFDKDDSNVLLSKKSSLKYLGFEFDGKNIRLKSSSLAKYQRNLKQCVKSLAKKAKHSIWANASREKPRTTKYGMIFKRKLFKQYSHLGGKSKTRNYNTYAKDAHVITGDRSIKKQLSKSWKSLNDEIRKYENKFHLHKDIK